MDELEANSDSVNFLISKLCSTAIREYGVKHHELVTRLKSKSFEILLKKAPLSSGHVVDEFDPMRELEMQMFCAKMKANTNPEENVNFEAFEKHLAFIEREYEYFSEDIGKQVLQLLLALQNTNSDNDALKVIRSCRLLVPGAFTLHACYSNVQYYPALVKQGINSTAPKYFKGIQSMKLAANNPYVSKLFLNGEPNLLERMERRITSTPFSSISTSNDCSFTGMTQRLWGNFMRIDSKGFRLFTDSRKASAERRHKQSIDNKKRTQNTLADMLEVTNTIISSTTQKHSNQNEMKEDGTEGKQIFSWNWENLEQFGIVQSKPFASESNIVLHLKCVHMESMGKPFLAKVITQKQFLQDVKSLTVGIQSDTFTHDENIVFSMLENITIDSVLPATIENFVRDFQECGTCYKRLQTMIMKRDYKLMFDGFMFKALCSAIDEYLITFRQYVFGYDDVYLMEFYKRMKKMMKQIVNLSYTLAIHPNVVGVKLPMGSQFLGYLYNEIVNLTEKDYITLLVFILKRCCHVYFKHFQKWIFYGLLDDPSNELFIEFVDHYRRNTKYFFDKAYFLRKQSVPGFLLNSEDQILQCGKYTMLLKACKPNHPLFILDYPAISVCLTFDEIRALEASCSKYYERAREICGKPITIREIFESRAEEKRLFFQRVSQRSRENMEKWSDEQEVMAAVVAEQKKKRFDELTAQLQDAKQRKIDERRANVELELRLLKDAEKLEECRLLNENINLRKRIEYYQELSDLMQSDTSKTSNKHSNINSILKRTVLEGDEGGFAKLSPQTPHTAGSSGTVDFESCDGEDDAVSDYVECISEDFLLKFERSEQELNALCSQKSMHDNNNPEEEDKQAQKTIEFGTTDDDDGGNLHNCNIKRSASDYLNSNELAVHTLSVAQTNREKALSGQNVYDCFNSNITNLKVTNVGDTKSTLLTEAQRNKLKVMSQEFDYFTEAHVDVNLNNLRQTDNHTEMSELQRNRRRMMDTNPFSEIEVQVKTQSERNQLNLELGETERVRNRRKVLESEFNIVTNNANSTTTFIVETTPATPMSTTSDGLLDIAEESCAVTDDRINNTSCNNKSIDNIIDSSKPNLKIDITAASTGPVETTLTQETIMSGSTELNAIASLLTANTATTPECALNTAGLMAKQGFSFPNQALQGTSTTPAVIQNSRLEHSDEYLPLFPSIDYKDPYQRCVKLIETNFKCATRCPHFRLNIPTKETSLEARLSAESIRRCMQNQLNLNSMSVTTLTEFLQKSMTIPMSTHFEVVNNEVMRMFLDDFNILSHFKSLRNYFLLMDGEFGAFITDGIIGKLEEEETTPERLFNYQILHSMLENALGSSIIGNDKNAVNLSFIVTDVPTEFDLTSPTVLDNLSLSYHVVWPLNLILSPETLDKYARIFRYLIKVRRISWVLERAYQILKEAVKRHGNSLLRSPQYRHLQQIRHKFYHFVHALQNHITANALQASWKTFKDNLLTAKSIEDIYHKHASYIKRILFLCMLNRQSLAFHKTIDNIFCISLKFYNNLKARDFKIRNGQECFTHSRYETLSSDEKEFDNHIGHVIYLGNKIVRHGYQEEIGEFISLINYNGYYTKNSGCVKYNLERKN